MNLVAHLEFNLKSYQGRISILSPPSKMPTPLAEQCSWQRNLIICQRQQMIICQQLKYHVSKEKPQKTNKTFDNNICLQSACRPFEKFLENEISKHIIFGYQLSTH